MARSGDEGLEQRLDRWMATGRQLVDGVSGARPGTRRSSGSSGSSRLKPAELGRWVENKLEWLLDDADDNWREPWQQQEPLRQAAPERAGRRRPRRRLEAISRRGLETQQAPPTQVPNPAESTDWPDDETFTVTRWQRTAAPASDHESGDRLDAQMGGGASQPLPRSGGRPLPRSTRRR